ncbi:hypothetical protein [Paraliomyxa miuraensis]|uniref:hypothetical protein n=1 Tax=Paraliomyxa miuraensis TaxID=376150 RepID=UPI00225838B2|nr:hypothetical protein [Paraliomyxa miuraensis]MCX4240362.1 hypothetical protein [Paraliomyxa miuraensis]
MVLRSILALSLNFSLALSLGLGACTGAQHQGSPAEEHPVVAPQQPVVSQAPSQAEPTPEPKPEPTSEPKPEPTLEPKPEPTPEPPVSPTTIVPTNGAPLTIEATHGFVQVEESSEAASGHLRFSSPPGSGCMVDARWWRPMPPDPGGPMVEASRRAVTVDGKATEVITTSMFEGQQQEVDAVFLRGEGYQIRIVFESCGALEEDGFLEGVRVVG